MKKHLALVAGMAVLSSSAYATKSRVAALGQNVDGSYYISDTRSVFLNPAYVTEFNKYIVAEWGNEGAKRTAGDTDTVGVGTEFLPNAEGGYFGSWRNFSYGIYLGREDSEANGACRTNAFAVNPNGLGTAQAVASGIPVLGCVGRSVRVAAGAVSPSEDDFLGQDNRVDLFVGGDHGIKWGLNFYWAQGDDDKVTRMITGTGTDPVDRESSTNGLSLGIMYNALEAWVHWGLQDKATGSTTPGDRQDTYEQDHNYKVGLSYSWKDYTFFGELEDREADEVFNDYTVGGAAARQNMVTTNMDRSGYRIGVGYEKAVNSKAKIFADFAYHGYEANISRTPTSTMDPATYSKESLDGWALPLNIGFETEVFSWLSARASVRQHLAESNDITRTQVVTQATNATVRDARFRTFDTADVTVGATLDFGKLKVDGLVGRSIGAGPAAGTEVGNLSLDQLMTRVGMTYWF